MTLPEFHFENAKAAMPYETISQADLCISALMRKTANSEAISSILFYNEMREQLSESDLLKLANEIGKIA